MKPERTKRSPRDDTARAAADRQAREIERRQRENDRLREQLDEQAKRIADLERQLALPPVPIICETTSLVRLV